MLDLSRSLVNEVGLAELLVCAEQLLKVKGLGVARQILRGDLGKLGVVLGRPHLHLFALYYF